MESTEQRLIREELDGLKERRISEFKSKVRHQMEQIISVGNKVEEYKAQIAKLEECAAKLKAEMREFKLVELQDSEVL